FYLDRMAPLGRRDFLCFQGAALRTGTLPIHSFFSWVLLSGLLPLGEEKRGVRKFLSLTSLQGSLCNAGVFSLAHLPSSFFIRSMTSGGCTTMSFANFSSSSPALGLISRFHRFASGKKSRSLIVFAKTSRRILN